MISSASAAVSPLFLSSFPSVSALPTLPATTVVEGKVGKADTLGKLLKKSGLTAAEADEIIRALSGVVDFRTIRAGQSFRIRSEERRVGKGAGAGRWARGC